MIYQHYRIEEHPFIDQALAWKEDVRRTFACKLTDFLNPREQMITTQLIGQANTDLILKFFGGGLYTERKRAIIAPFYEQITNDDFQLTLFEADFAEKFLTISHRDVMGSFLSLGLDRKKLGDIFIVNGKLQLLTTKELAPYVQMNLTRIKRANIQLREVSLSNLQETKPNWKKIDKIVSSLRIDVMIKEIYQISRKKAANLITQQRVRVNFKTVDDVKFLLEPGDVLSVRGRGRSKIFQVHDRTKKNNIRVTIGRLA